ncbi:MAG: DUF2330 domain-containing protein [Actinomycetota bacterium]
MLELGTATSADLDTIVETVASSLNAEAMLRWPFGDDRFHERIRRHFAHYNGTVRHVADVAPPSFGKGVAFMWTRLGVRAAASVIGAAALMIGAAGTALACGGLIAPNGTISLTHTTTLAAYHDGVEHYITSFSYAGDASGDVGSIVPLPGVPINVIKGGDWTLQRLQLEVHPPSPIAGVASTAEASGAKVILRTTVDSLDITVLKGGALDVGTWASDHGFFLPPDAPEVLAFYAQRSPIFMAVKFDAERAAAQGVSQGEGTPVDVVIPTPHPWVPLRILTLGQDPRSLVQADVFLLTDRQPAMLPQAVQPARTSGQEGLIQRVSEPASASLLNDLRSDDRMSWVPQHMWFTFIDVNARAADLTHDLSIDASGFAHPDPVAAGYAISERFGEGTSLPTVPIVLAIVVTLAVLVEVRRHRGLVHP